MAGISWCTSHAHLALQWLRSDSDPWDPQIFELSRRGKAAEFKRQMADGACREPQRLLWMQRIELCRQCQLLSGTWVLFLVLNCCHFGNVSTEFICLHKPWGPGFMQAIGYNFLLAKAGCKALRNCSMLHGCYTGVTRVLFSCAVPVARLLDLHAWLGWHNQSYSNLRLRWHKVTWWVPSA